MAKFSTLKQRSISATVFAAIMILGIYCGSSTFLILFGVILVLALREVFGLILLADQKIISWYKTWGVIIASIPFFIIAYEKSTELKLIQSHYAMELVLVMPLFICLIAELLLTNRQVFNRIGAFALSILYLVIPICLLVDMAIQQGIYRPNLVMGLLLMCWINDSGAYFVGSMMGKRKLYFKISPGKTWEGSIGGLIFAVTFALFFSNWFGLFAAVDWAVLAVIAAIFGTIGDLVESMLKRNLGIKDSGNIMPGHGGILDRFDAFIFLIPFAYLYLYLMKYIS